MSSQETLKPEIDIIEDELHEIEFCATKVGINLNEIKSQLPQSQVQAVPTKSVAKCSFCKLGSSQVKEILYQDNHLLVYLHPKPLCLGHLLIFPRTHCSSFYELHPLLVEKIFQMTSQLSVALKKVFPKSSGISLFLNDSQSGVEHQSHLNLNLFPRTKDDGFHFKAGANQGKNISADILEKTAVALKRHFQGEES